MDYPFEERVIGKHTYRVSALPMDQWDELGEFLAEFLGEPVTSLVKGFDIGDLRELMLGDAGALGVLVSVVSKKITRGRMGKVRTLMGHALKVKDDDGNWAELDHNKQNHWWASNRGELPDVVWLFLKVQYVDFFTGFGALMPSKKPSETSPGKSTKENPGSSQST